MLLRGCKKALGLPSLRCPVHCSNLLFQGIAGPFEEFFVQPRTMLQFFQNVNYAHITCLPAMSQGGGTHLCAPVETRWASVVDCLQSSLKNRLSVEDALLTSRRENLSSSAFSSRRLSVLLCGGRRSKDFTNRLFGFVISFFL